MTSIEPLTSNDPTSSNALRQDHTFFGLKRLPARYAGVVMPFLLSILMTLIVSFISTVRSVGFPDGFLHLWAGAWALSWVVAFPTLLLMLPLVKKLTGMIVRAE